MEMHEIRYFLAASDTLNFHRAAELVHVTQPALTRAIQKLEAELGGYLFLRERGRIRMTDFGCLMQTHLGEVLQRSESAKRTAQDFLSLQSAPLTLGVMCTIGPVRFVGFLNTFREQHPGIEVTLIEGPAHRLAELLVEGKLEIALLASPAPLDRSLVVEPVYRERFGLAFPAGHKLEKRNTIHLTDARDETYLDRINCEYGNHIDQLCRNIGLVIENAYRSEREDWILAMVAAGMGVCFIAEYSATHPGVCHRPLSDPEIVREVSLVSVAGRSRSAAATAFCDAVSGYAWVR